MTAAMTVEYVTPQSLKPADYNPREIGPDALRRLTKLMDRHGFVVPVVARREDGLVIAGHQRLKANALRKTPDERVPVLYLDGLSDARAKALNIALNNERAMGRFDPARLSSLVAELCGDTVELADIPAVTGFDEIDVENLLAQAGDVEVPEVDIDLPEIFEVVVEASSESEQKELYDRMKQEGLRCRLLTL